MALPTPISYFKFDESSGTATDSVGGFNATNVAVTYSAGKINNGANFNGSSSILTSSTSSTLSPTAALSLSFWIKTTTNGLGALCMKFDESSYNAVGWAIYTAGTNQIQFIAGAGTGYPNVTVTCPTNYYDGAWHHVVATYSGATTTGKIYFDGSFVGSNTSMPAALTQASLAMVFGTRLDGFGPDRYYAGSLDEFGIWGVELSSADVTTLWNGGAGLQYPFAAAFTPTPLIHMMQISGGNM